MSRNIILTLLSPVCVPLQIREEIEQYGIKIYQFPDCDSDEDEEFKQQDLELKVRIRAAKCLGLWSFSPLSFLCRLRLSRCDLMFILSMCQLKTWIRQNHAVVPVT